MKTTTINPWYMPGNSYSRRTFEYHEKPTATHRGVDVFKNYSGSYDYVIQGVTIAQRGKAEKTRIQFIIDELLDGKTPCATPVHDHLRKLGFSPMSYDQYTKLWLAGMAA